MFYKQTAQTKFAYLLRESKCLISYLVSFRLRRLQKFIFLPTTFLPQVQITLNRLTQANTNAQNSQMKQAAQK